MGINAASAAQIGQLALQFSDYGRRKESAIVALCQIYSQKGANYARQRAPWTDRTGNARQFLHGKVVKDSMIRARISHGVYYGIYLEKKYSGRYSILPKVLRQFSYQFLEDVQKVAAGREVTYI